jgi:hypothetical protein
MVLVGRWTLLKLPRRTAWRVRTPNQISIWFIHDVPFGVKWNTRRVRYPCFLSAIFRPAWNPGAITSQ